MLERGLRMLDKIPAITRLKRLKALCLDLPQFPRIHSLARRACLTGRRPALWISLCGYVPHKQRMAAMDKHLLVRNGGGKDYDYSQDHCFVKLAAEQTDGNLSFVEDHLKPGFSLGRHYHKIMTELFYVLDGEVRFQLDAETIIAKAGDTLTIPPHVWHSAECANGGKMLTIFLNGRFDEYLERLNSMTDAQFQDAGLMRSTAEEFDTYEA